jgi:hypothetical protein
MTDKQVVPKLMETWARAAALTSSHERDYFIEAIRAYQRKKEEEARAEAERQSEKSA